MMPRRSVETEAVATVLEASTPHPVGRGSKPPGGGYQGAPGQSDFAGYYVLHPIPGGGLDGPMGDTFADADLIVQVNSHGATQRQCATLADDARDVLLAQPDLAIEGRTLNRIEPDVIGGATRDDADSTVWFCADRYRISTTPT